jgi:hypothetical protein
LFRLPPYEEPPAIDIWLVRHPQARVNRAEAEFTRLLLKRVAETPRRERVYGLTPHRTGTGKKAKAAPAKRRGK